MKDENLFGLFKSSALIDGKHVMIGVEESEAIKEAAVTRGLLDTPEKSSGELGWMEDIILFFRHSTTPEGFDHEFWGAWTLMPPWAQRVVSMHRGGWLDFPTTLQNLTPESLGRKTGEYLGLSEMKISRISEDETYRTNVEAKEWESAVRGLMTRDAEKVKVMLPGFENLLQMALENTDSLMQLRMAVFARAGAQSMKTSSLFFKGLVTGQNRAQKVDLASELSDYNLKMDVIERLFCGWNYVAQLSTRTEVSKYVLDHLPESKQAFFRADEQRWESFQKGVLRDLYDEIGLNPGTRGRPRKNRADSNK